MDEPVPAKQRHGCLTTWLVLTMIFNGLGALAAAAMMKLDPAGLPEGVDPADLGPPWVMGVSAVLMVLNVVFAFALFQWKKWAFFGYCATAAISGAIGLATDQWSSVIGAVIGILLLYLVLQIGGVRKGWTQLE